ncbi:hypothetical protein [Streptomyces acidicola]|nr:hypothetical protein [Streptomyces acidicola]
MGSRFQAVRVPRRLPLVDGDLIRETGSRAYALSELMVRVP